MNTRILNNLAGLLLLLIASGSYLGAQPVSKFVELEKYLQREMVGPEAVRVIMDHLSSSGTNTPLDDLVGWAKAGFPDLHDERGIWKTESISLRLGVVRALYYYLSTLPEDGKSARYLAVIDELQNDDYITYHLTGMAYLVVDEATLEAKVLKLLDEKDPKLRSQGALMGSTIAQRKRFLFERYYEMLKNDNDSHVRTTILSSIIGWRTRESAFVELEILVNDRDAEVRALAARGLQSAADRNVLSADDLSTLLRPMLKTSDAFARVSIGRAAAKMATSDRSLYIRREKFTDDLLQGFIRDAKQNELSDADLVKLWMEWWTPLIPQYTVRAQIVR